MGHPKLHSNNIMFRNSWTITMVLIINHALLRGIGVFRLGVVLEELMNEKQDISNQK